MECIDRLSLGSYVRILCDWSGLVCVNRVESVIVGGWLREVVFGG